MSQPTFIRVFSQTGQKEILVNLNSIWKVEVVYAILKGDTFHPVSLSASTDPDAVRVYTLFFGSETVKVAFEDSPVFRAVEELYKNAIKG